MRDQNSRLQLRNWVERLLGGPLVGQEVSSRVVVSPLQGAAGRLGPEHRESANCTLLDRATELEAARPRPWTEVSVDLETAVKELTVETDAVQDRELEQAWSLKEHHYQQVR